MVESASVALGLRLTRPWLWDRLAPDVQDRAEQWLRARCGSCSGGQQLVPLPVHRRRVPGVGGPGRRGDGPGPERASELLEHWYRGDGWYADGDGRAFDHYNGWALHLYPLLDAHLAGDERSRRITGGRGCASTWRASR